MPIRSTETARVPEDISGHQRRMPVGGITWRHTFRALRHRNYRLFFWGQLVSLVGTWMQQTAMMWFVYDRTNSKLLLGLVAAVGSAPMVFSSVWGGALADLYPKRAILVVTQAAQMLCAFLLAAGVWLGFATPEFIMIVAAFNGTAMGFDMPARQAFTVEMTSREDLLNAISLNSSIVNGARVVGPSVAGLMIGALGVAMCFFLNGLSFVAVIAGFLMMRLPRFQKPAHAVSAGEHAWNGRLVIRGADASFRARRAQSRCKRLRDLDVGERARCFLRGAGRSDLRTSVYTAMAGARWRLVIFRCFARAFAKSKFLRCACMSSGCRIWNAPLFFYIEHCTANDRAG